MYVYSYDYNCMSPSLSYTLNDVLGYSVSLFGDYTVNSATNTANTGYGAGIKFGSPSIANQWDWQFQYLARYLEKDAWLDALPDSDSYGGKTNAKGFELIFNLALTKNLTMTFDYYSMDAITGASVTTPLAMYQLDATMKF